MRQKYDPKSLLAMSILLSVTLGLDCGCPNCNLDLLATDSSGAYSCRDRITFVMNTHNLLETAACTFVGNEFPNICKCTNCTSSSIYCGCKDCTSAVLNRVATSYGASYTCQQRIDYMKQTLSDTAACAFVSDEFPTVCGPACHPDKCGNQHDTLYKSGEISNGHTCPNLLWKDEFLGSTLNVSKWTFDIGDGCSQGLCGWGNNQLQIYDSSNAYVSRGKLVIEARQNGQKITSARVKTEGLERFQYGHLEASIKIPKGQGIWPAFWMLPTNPIDQWPISGEIDIMENIGREPSRVHGAIHYGKAWPYDQHEVFSADLLAGDAFSDNFHVFSIDWQPNSIRWAVDGAEMAATTKDDVSPSTWPFNAPFHFILNVAVGGTWSGYPDNTTIFPQKMEIDYVRAYDKTLGRLVGPQTVHKGQAKVAYSINEGLDDYAYVWHLPTGVVPLSGTRSSTVSVTFGNAGGYIRATATSSSCGIKKVFSMPVAVGPSLSGLCRCNTCTLAVLDSLATDGSGTYSCRDRIIWVMRQTTEQQACLQVSNEFPVVCGGCSPTNRKQSAKRSYTTKNTTAFPPRKCAKTVLENGCSCKQYLTGNNCWKVKAKMMCEPPSTGAHKYIGLVEQKLKNVCRMRAS